MKLDIYELSMKAILGLELTDEERLLVQRRNAKYALVRYVYMEKMKHNGKELVDFQFTPGESFVDTPVIDIVNELLKINKQTYEVLNFGDMRLIKSNPPHTGKAKTTLGE